MMTPVDFVRYMVDTYGVRSCLENDDDDSIWFECPECGEPILIGLDYSLEECKNQCPICEEPWE